MNVEESRMNGFSVWFHFGTQLQTWNKLKSLKVAKWREDEWRMMTEKRMMKDDDVDVLMTEGQNLWM